MMGMIGKIHFHHRWFFGKVGRQVRFCLIHRVLYFLQGHIDIYRSVKFHKYGGIVRPVKWWSFSGS